MKNKTPPAIEVLITFRMQQDFSKESRESDNGICIYDSHNKTILSTELSKYWDYKHDKRTLDEFIHVLNDRVNLKMTAVNIGS